MKDCIRWGVRGAVGLAVGAAGLLAVSAVTVGPAGASPAPSWSIVSSPNAFGLQRTYLDGVSCTNSVSCAAVGYYYSGSVYQTLVEHWNGTNWSIEATPDTSSSQNNDLFGVSCTGSASCTAVGNYYNGTVNQTLIEAWNGTSWSIVASPNTSVSQNNYLYAVSCASSASCAAVGYYYNGSVYQTLVEHWNGTSWSIAASPNTSGSQDNYFNGVSCTSSVSCTAVGDYFSAVSQTLIEHWNGTSWSIAASPNTSASQDNYLYAVSCASSTSCKTVGAYDNSGVYQTLIETWNGTSWSIVASPNTSASQQNVLLSVSCTNSTSCTTVGYYYNGSSDQTLAEAWNGTNWSIVASPNASVSHPNILYGVSCTSATSCIAAGDYYNGILYQSLTEAWNGTSWSIKTSPSASAFEKSWLNGVSCASAASCTAVGYYFNGTRQQTLAEAWNGTSWSVEATPDTSSSQNNELFGVSCTSPVSCTAVGRYNNGSAFQTLAENWNGTSWSIKASPNTSPSRTNVLDGVSCTSANSCRAVGFYYNGTVDQTLIEAWNGTNWSVIASANTLASQGNALLSVSCTSATSCAATGDYYNGSAFQTLAENWNGASWSIKATPNTSPSQSNVLDGVSCTGAASCTAVGSYYNGTWDQTLIEEWNGTSWSIAASPNTSSLQFNLLTGISCASSTSCTAAGSYYNGTAYQTLIEEWNGTSWAIAATANTSSSQNNNLNGVSCTGTVSCTAVGYDQSLGVQTLVEMSTPAPAKGYWFVASDGGIFSFGSAAFYGSMGAKHLNQPIVGMAATPDGKGYWFVASDGGIFSFGSAAFYGSMGAKHLNQPIVGMAATPDGKGYWFVASDGGIFSFGSAAFYGSMGAKHLNQPIVGMAATPDGKGYWFVASDGGIFSFGDATFYGSMGAKPLNKPIVGMATTPDGRGYWFVASDGGIFSFGDAKFLGSMGGKHLNKPIVGMAANPDGRGYWFVASDGGIFSFGDAKFFGSMGAKPLNKPIVGMSAS